MSQVLLLLRPRPWKWVGVSLVCLLFTATGIWMAGRAVGASDVLKAWGCLLFFGAGTVVALLQFHPKASQLILTREGLFITSTFRTKFIPWARIERFGVIETTRWHGPFRSRHRQVGLLLLAPEHGSDETGKAALLSLGMTGFHGALPDNYGYEHKELAALMNDHLQRYRSIR